MRSIRWAISGIALTLSASIGAAPSVTLVAPAGGERYVAPAAIELAANPAVDAGRSIERVEFLADGNVIGVATQAPYTFSWVNVARGNYNLRARVYDSAGARDNSPVVRVNVRNNTAPKVRLSAPEHRYIAPGAVPLSATVTDRDDPIAKVEFFNGDVLLSSTAAEPYAFDWTGVPAGDYDLRAKATDILGATGTSNVFRVRVRDNAAPHVRILTPDNKETFPGPASIAVSLKANDRDDNLTNVELFANGAALATFTGAAPYEFNWTGVAPGTYTLTARATDDLGLTTTSRTVTIQVTGSVPRELKMHFIEVDHLNTPRRISDTENRTVWTWDQQEPFGNNLPDENQSGLGVFEFPLRFPGQYFDRETNLAYNYHRDYDSGLGAYKQSDPVGLNGGLNSYSYVNGSPLSLTDIAGLDAIVAFYPGGVTHIGIGVNTSNTTGLYPALKSVSAGVCRDVRGAVMQDANYQMTASSPPKLLRIKTTPEQDVLMQQFITQALANGPSSPYNLCSNQCTNFVIQTLKTGGVALPDDDLIAPNRLFDSLSDLYGTRPNRPSSGASGSFNWQGP